MAATQKQANPQAGTVTTAVFAATAASVARAAASPLSVLKINSMVGRTALIGPYYCAKGILAKEGVNGLFKGGGIAAVRLFPYTMTQIAVFDGIVRTMIPRQDYGNRLPTLYHHAVVYGAGAVAGVLAQTLTHPLDVVKTRMVMSPLALSHAWYTSPQDCFRKTLQLEGVTRGLYRGFLPSVAGAAAMSGTLFLAWDMMENLPWRKRGAPDLIYFESLVLAGAAMGAAYFSVLPLDVIRKKMMAHSSFLPKNGGVLPPFNGGIEQCVRQTYSHFGLYGFVVGAASNGVKLGVQLLTLVAVTSFLHKVIGRRTRALVVESPGNDRGRLIDRVQRF